MKSGGRVFLFLCLLPLFALSQDVQVYDPTTTSDATTPNEIPAEADDPVAEAELDRAKVTKQMGQIATAAEAPERALEEAKNDANKKVDQLGIAIDKNLLELQGELKAGKSSTDILLDPVLRKKLVQAYEDNPMAKMPVEDLRSMVETQLQQTPLKNVVKTFPKILDFIVNLMHHPKALGKLVQMLDRPDDLKLCGYVSLALFVFVFILRKVLIKPRTRFFKRIGITLSTSALLLGGSLGFVWFSFQEELSPTLDVVSKTFF
jgi:hypothetical protein